MIAIDRAGAVELAADVIVVGSGAGGSAAAWELTTAGRDVLLLEAGAYHDPAAFDQRETTMMPRLYAGAGQQGTRDQSMIVMSGTGLGGSTVHNTALCVPPPPAILERWEREAALPGTRAEVDAAVATAMQRFGARAIEPGEENDNNRLLRAGAVKLGLAHLSPLHNRIGCSGCGHCVLGCAYNRKHHAVFAFLEEAVARGLRIATGARAVRVVRRGDAWEVRGPGFTARARTVVLAASALATPVLLQQSGLGGAAVGRTLRLHPFAPVAALFEPVVDAHRGVPQSTLITAGSRFLNGARGGFLLMASPAGPAATAAFMPGHGASVAELMRRWRHLAVAGVLLHDQHPARVRARSDGRPSIDAWPVGDDIAQLRAGVDQLARLWFAAGATDVLLPFARRPRIHSVAELDGLDRLPFRKWDVSLNSVHPHGSVPIGRADSAPLTPEGAVRGAPGLFVADGSVLPTSVGVPPQVAISAFALCIARGIAGGARSRA